MTIKIEKQHNILLHRYETLFINSPDGIACFDKNHIILDVNDSFVKIFGYSKDECIGRNLDDLVVPKEMKREVLNMTNELFEKGILNFEATRYTKTGHPVIVNIRGILMKLDGEILGGYAIYTDITEKVKYKNELEATIDQLMSSEEELRAQYDEIQEYTEKNEELRQKYEIAIEATGSFIWEVKIHQKTINFSKNFIDLVGYDAIQKESIYEVIEKVVYEEDRCILIDSINRYLAVKDGNIDTQIRIIDKNGQIHWYLVRGKTIKDRDGNPRSVHGELVDITEIMLKEECVTYMADRDPLTGLYNRRKFSEVLRDELNNSRKGAIFLLDIDDFKNINDILGHVYGDEVLKRVASMMKDTSWENMIAFRFGGDEFLVLLKEHETHKIEEYAERLIGFFRDRIIVDQMENSITVSVGIVQYPNDGNNIDDLLIKADIAMYNVKRKGKNNYLFFDEKMKEKFNKKIRIENILRKALKNESFVLYYQPIIETRTGKVASFEALLRIKDFNISPEVFIPIAEETGLIIPIGKWVIKEAIKQMRRWRDKGHNSLPISINLSPRQFFDINLIDYIKKTLEEYDVDPSFLEVEITENVFAEKKFETVNILNRLKALGVMISLDDFGTGYSSLNYLTFMPLDKVKLDKSLKDKFIELENIKIMDSLIALVHGLNLKVVTEGVEEVEEFRRMRRAGSDYLQGYLFSKPITIEEIGEILNKDYTKLLPK